MKIKLLQNSTALAVVLALTAAPLGQAFAQQSAAEAVDCAADPTNPECAASNGRAPAPAPEAPAAEQPAAPAEGAPAPAESTPAPTEQAPAEPAPAPAEQTVAPAEEAPAPAEPAPAPAEQAPAPKQPAEPKPVAPAPGDTGPIEQEKVAPAPGDTGTIGESTDNSAGGEVGTTTVQPVEQQGGTTVRPASGAGEGQEPKEAEPTPAVTEGQQSAPEATTEGRTETAVPSETVPEGQSPRPEGGVAVMETETPASIVPDDITEEQRANIKVEEKKRREEARDNRGQLLGAAAVGAVIGALIPALGGKVVEDEGDRIIVERDGEYFVRKDESSLLRDGDVSVNVERLRGGRTQETITRRNGVQIVTIRDQGGYILYRSRIMPDGREYVIVDNREFDDREFVDYDRRLPPLRMDIARDVYIVEARQASPDVIYRTFAAPPVEQVEQAYSLRQVRESERLREKVRRVDLDSITFDTGSATVRESQVPYLEDIARATLALVEDDPSTVLLVEGHTDAVGSELSNLALSDRRAETVARILADRYGVPPENMVIQGYGEQYLKVDTQGPEQQNRRVTMRNITSLLSAQK
jgi:outer membrane protein OmpA-like peptidoglycan-associated protein